MTAELIQDGIVTLAAMGAGSIIVRRVVGFAWPSKRSSGGCSNCASASKTCHPSTAARDQRQEPELIQLIRPR